MRTAKLAAGAYVFLVFLSGALVGGLGYRFYMVRDVRAEQRPRSSEEYRRRYIEEMRTRLALSEEQVKQLDTILDATRSRYRELREKVRPETKQIQQIQVEHIRAILTPNQLSEYEKMQAERERRRKEEVSHHH